MAKDARSAFAEGLADAVGFLGGALAGWQLGRLLGFDVLAPADAPLRSLVAWGLLLAGLAAGKWAALQWRAGRANAKE